MSSELDEQYVLIGKSVDILFHKTDMEAAHERKIVGLSDGLLVCIAPDAVTEWYPLTSILSIIDRSKPRSVSPVKSYYGL
jgi:hypothetical protein